MTLFPRQPAVKSPFNINNGFNQRLRGEEPLMTFIMRGLESTRCSVCATHPPAARNHFINLHFSSICILKDHCRVGCALHKDIFSPSRLLFMRTIYWLLLFFFPPPTVSRYPHNILICEHQTNEIHIYPHISCPSVAISRFN